MRLMLQAKKGGCVSGTRRRRNAGADMDRGKKGGRAYTGRVLQQCLNLDMTQYSIVGHKTESERMRTNGLMCCGNCLNIEKTALVQEEEANELHPQTD